MRGFAVRALAGFSILAFGGLACDVAREDGDDEEAAVVSAEGCIAALDRISPAALHPEGRVDPDHEATVLAAARTCLSEYVQVNTSNPRTEDGPGEIAAVEFYQAIFNHLGIESRTAPLAGVGDPKRQSLVATLRGRQRAKSVVLLNHTDVVRAEGSWKHPPFSGDDDGAFVWGRGALDMKSIGITQLIAMALIKRAGFQLTHDIHFVAVADEEVGGRGSEYIALKKMVDEERNEQVDPLGLQPGVVLNEGGTGIRDALVDRRDVFVIGTEEKGALWTQFAHQDLKALITGFAKLGAAKGPPDASLPDASTRSSLGSACGVVAAVTDEVQAVNVVPRHATLTFDCKAGTKAALESAAQKVGRGFEHPPTVTVTSEPGGPLPPGGGPRETSVVAIEMGAGGHGSQGGASALDVAVGVLVAAGQLDSGNLSADSKIRDRLFAYRLSPSNQEFISTIARAWGKVPGELAEDLVQSRGIAGAALRLFHDDLPTDAPFRNTCNWTTLKFPVDGEARGKLDCRTSFDTKTKTLEGALSQALGEQGIVLRADRAQCADCYRQEFNASGFDDSAASFQIIRAAHERSSPDAIVSPYLFPASSDSYFFRRIGVPTYGVMPAALGQAELTTFHGLDERMPVAALFPAVRMMTEIVLHLGNDAAIRLAPELRLGSDSVRCQEFDDPALAKGHWKPVDELVCDSGLSKGTAFRCTRGASAPRFLRMVPRGNDGRIYDIVRLKPGISLEDGTPDPSHIDKVLYKSRETGSDPSTRVFDGKEVEIDTGAGDDRVFLLRCATPTAQIGLNLTKTRVEFYRD
jgi:acetylornithine deacetylase/succinyl-diaminopimelate desuccinylase-like protein